MQTYSRNSSGFTLVEILIAMAVFAAIAGASTYVMMGTLSANKAGVSRLQVTSDVQKVAEDIKSAWDSSNALNAQYYSAVISYSNGCIPNLTLPANVSVTMQTLDRRGGNPGAASALPACPSGIKEKLNPYSPMRRVTVKAAGKANSTVILDIIDPCVKVRVMAGTTNTTSCLGE